MNALAGHCSRHIEHSERGACALEEEFKLCTTFPASNPLPFLWRLQYSPTRCSNILAPSRCRYFSPSPFSVAFSLTFARAYRTRKFPGALCRPPRRCVKFSSSDALRMAARSSCVKSTGAGDSIRGGAADQLDPLRPKIRSAPAFTAFFPPSMEQPNPNFNAANQDRTAPCPNQGMATPMWPPQYWQQLAMNSTLGGNIPLPNTQNTNPPCWTPIPNESGRSQSPMFWNPFVAMLNTPYGCPTPPMFGGPSQPPITGPILQGSNTHPDQPIHLESEGENSVQEINSPAKTPPINPRGKKAKAQNFKTDDDLLCKTWLEISSDPVVNTRQRKEGLWARIENRYNDKRGEYPSRVNRALSSRWYKIRRDCSKFDGYYARVLRENQNGLTDHDKTGRAATLFATEEKRVFHFMHCWEILKNEPKWQSIVQGTCLRGVSGAPTLGTSPPSFTVDELDSATPGLSGKRPLGRDSSKSERKKAATTSSESAQYLSKLLELTIERIRKSNERFEKEKIHYELYRDLELKKLELEEKELSRRERELEQQEKDAQLESDKLLAKIWDEVPEDVKPYMLKRRKHLAEYLMNN